MIHWRRGGVMSLGREWPGALELSVDVDGSPLLALAYPALTGRPEIGDEVLVNVGALVAGPGGRALGTGGYAPVIALPTRLPVDPPAGGHLVKARYTPQQVMVGGADEQGSPHHDLLRDADDLGAMPVITADLHSALAAICAAIAADAPGTRVAYVLTDGGALPAWFSRTVPALRGAGLLVGAVSTGQSFGGDLECVSLHSGLLAARVVLGADIAVVAPGPGNLGTGTRWGFSGVAAGEAVNAAATLGGRPVACLRLSAVDERERHRGVSHHSLTAYGRVALAPADVAVPLLTGAFGAAVRAQCAPLATSHRLVEVDLAGLREVLEASAVPLSSMGRDLSEDPACFLAAAAAGRHAASLLGQ
ncbi:MAG: DUF3866 family protein [Sporichthyaceae bacterium]